MNTAPLANKEITRGNISYNGKKVIIREDSKKTAQLLDAAGNVLMEFKGHRDYINSAFFSPDGKYIVTAGDDRTARLWKVSVRRWREDVSPGRAPPDFKRAVSPDGRYIVEVTRRSNTLYLRDEKAGRQWKMEGHEKVVNSAAFSPSGGYIVTASMDGTARLWDLTGNELRVFRGHKESVNSACFSPGGKYIVTASSDRTIRFWNPNGIRVFEFEEFNDIVNSASFSLDGKYILIFPAHGPAQIRLVDAEEIIRIVNKQCVWQLDDEVKKTYRIN
jgi:WD40 repeat protein